MAPTAVGGLRATSMIPTAYAVGEYADSSSELQYVGERDSIAVKDCG
jgi:hypothetical protein